jgi:hypothetical protein
MRLAAQPLHHLGPSLANYERTGPQASTRIAKHLPQNIPSYSFRRDLLTTFAAAFSLSDICDVGLNGLAPQASTRIAKHLPQNIPSYSFRRDLLATFAAPFSLSDVGDVVR